MFVDNYHPVANQAYTANGEVLREFAGRTFDTGLRRPYFDKNGHVAMTVNTGRTTLHKGQQVPIKEHRLIRDLILNGVVPPVFNATALRKEEWLQLDTTVLRAARYPLIAWSDLAARNNYGGFNGMGKLLLEHETMSDPGEAMVDMDGLTAGRSDRPTFQLEGVPLPITHSDFQLGSRVLTASRNGNMPLDANLGEASARRVGETLEKTLIGNQTGITYGGNSTQVGGYGRASSVYGYVNFPNRLTKSGLYKPTGLGRSGTGWKPSDTLQDVLACLDQLRLNKFTGPWMLYHSNDWDQYMDNDYILTGGNVATQTLRNRLRQIGKIEDVKRVDFLFASTPDSTKGPGGENLNASYPFTLIFVQMTPDVAQTVDGLAITTVQWEGKGGMQVFFKVMCIQVPRLRADRYGNCGILHATATI